MGNSDAKKPTIQYRVENLLQESDAPLSIKEIAERARFPRENVRTALEMLHSLYSGCDYISECDCRRWYLTPQKDKRKVKREEAKPQGPGYRSGSLHTRKRNFYAEANALADAMRARRKMEERDD